MNIVWSNKFVAIVAGASMLAAVEFVNIYVPDKVNDKFLFRFEKLREKLALKTAMIAAGFNYGTELELFRSIHAFLIRITTLNKIDNRSSSVFVSDTIAGAVPIRIYYPNGITRGPEPVMFFFHGGGYCTGSVNGWDSISRTISKESGIVVISVDYRLAPEFAYPLPIKDCFSAIFHVLDHMKDFNLNIDTTKIIFAGDSAGANIATIISTQFIQHGKYTPRAQVLVYPPTQYYSFLLPSSIQYSNLELTSRAKLSLMHMGLTHVNKFQEDFLIKNYHTLLLKDPLLKEKFESYLSVDLIPEEFKKERFYYNNYANLNDFVYPVDSEEYDLEKLDPQFVQLVRNLFETNVSPGLLDDAMLENQPETLIMICEHDTRKDEGLIYAERLRRAGNEVDIKYYENGYHGILLAQGTVIGQRMRRDINEFVKRILQ